MFLVVGKMSIENLKIKFNQLTLESEDHWDYRGNSKSERDYVHGFCTYPAMMVPKMQREILDVCLLNLENQKPCLLDPFAGSGRRAYHRFPGAYGVVQKHHHHHDQQSGQSHDSGAPGDSRSAPSGTFCGTAPSFPSGISQPGG